jgi:hypothetical protein
MFYRRLTPSTAVFSAAPKAENYTWTEEEEKRHYGRV